ncbi:MAG: PLP-dependent aminotransferase family protein [Pseudonocardiaceae bacterium]
MTGKLDRSTKLATVLGDWSSGPGPLYRKLTETLHRLVEEGALASGDRLPSERELASALAVSRSTVVAAFDELRSQGIVESRQGSGTRVATGPAPRADGRVPGGRGAAIFQRLIDGPGELISLACATEGGAPEIAGALEDVLRHDLPLLLAASGYEPRGLPALRATIAEHFTTLGLPTCMDEVLVTTGAHQGLALVADLHRRNLATVLVEAPSWPACLDVFQAAGAQLSAVPLDDEGIDVHALARALREHQPALLYVMPTYHNPTGILMSADRRRRVAQLAARHDVPVVEDNAYSGLTTGADGEIPAPLAAYSSPDAEVLTIGSLGKVVWAGLRIGWVRAPAAIIERLARRKALADLGSPVLDQALAARLLPRLGELAARRSDELRGKLALLERLLTEQLPHWRWRRPDGGSGLWVQLPQATDAGTYAQLALRYGVELVPGSAMDPSGRHNDHLRVPFTLPPETIAQLVSRLAATWADLKRHGPCDAGPLRPIV